MVKTFIEFDIYQMSYELYYSGTHVGSFENKEDVFYEYRNVLQKFIIFMINMNLMKDF